MGTEGTLDQVLLKTRFEEAKHKELKHVTRLQLLKKPAIAGTTVGFLVSKTRSVKGGQQIPAPKRWNLKRKLAACFNCGLEGHLKREYPYPTQTKDFEANGRLVSVLTGDNLQIRIKELTQQLKDGEMVQAVQVVTGTMHGVEAETEVSNSMLGPTIRTPIQVNVVTADALVDTGSPATIISLELLLKVLAHNRPPGQMPADWQEATLAKSATPQVTLNSYGGHQLDLTVQIQVQLSQGPHTTDAVVLVVKGAPNELLLRIDLQPQLGLTLIVAGFEGSQVLFGKQGGEVVVKEAGVGTGGGMEKSSGKQHGMVSLINRTKIAPQHCKLVRAMVGDGVGKD